MQRNAIEPILGALVLVAAVAFLVFAYNKAGQRSFSGYPLTARFSSIDGLETGGDVRIGGVKVGSISCQFYPEGYVDATVIHLASVSGQVLTLSFNPLTGNVGIVSGDVPPATALAMTQ